MKVKRLTTTAITYLLTIFLFDQSIALAQQGASSTPQTPLVDSNNVRVEQQAAPATEPQVGDSRLEELIEQALANNPEIKSMQRRFDMMRARIPQAKALDEPVLIQQPDTRTELRQQILSLSRPDSSQTISESLSPHITFRSKATNEEEFTARLLKYGQTLV